MLDVKEAAQRASEYFADLFKGVSDPQLEEVELADDGQEWFITLSYPVRSENPFILGSGRQYKVFRIDARTGEVRSMKIRKVD